QAQGRPARVLRDRGAGAVQGVADPADQPPVAVLLCRQRVQQGRSGGAGRWLRLDRRTGPDDCGRPRLEELRLMAHVNLLPWRAERRKQREREFYMQLGAAFVVAVLVLLLWIFWMNQRIDNQNERNTYLQTEIKQLDVRIAKIKDLETVRAHLLARKQIIEQLQADRSQMVHLFDELVKTIPSSARLTSLKQSGQSMSLDGVAQSNASVAEYMRNIET